MELYLGGAGDYKLDYVKKKQLEKKEPLRVVDGAVATDEEIINADILNHFHLWVRRNIEKPDSLRNRLADILQKNPGIAIICDEIGCGIVPMDSLEREYRELTGRICCELAEQANSVERILFGIGQKLK